jgi:hypothetical protein
MMMKNLSFAVAMLSVGLWAGCATGGGGHTGGQIQVTVNTNPAGQDLIGVTLTAQFVATVTHVTSQAVTWSLTHSDDTACAAACGTISASGLYTAPPVAPDPATIKVVATSVESPTKTGTFSLTVTQITVTVTPKVNNALLNVVKGVIQQFTALAVPDVAPQTFNWTLSCDGGGTSCGTINVGTGLFTAPSNMPANPSGHVTATSTIDPTGSATVDINLVNSRLNASTTYAFRFSGFDSNGPLAVAGNFATDANGAITSGNEDELTANASNQCTVLGTSTYASDTNDHGTLTLRTSAGCAANSRSFKVAMGADGNGRMIEFDANGRGSGEIAQADQSKFNKNKLPSGSTFVFGLTGVDQALKRAGFVGLFKPDGAGGITSGMLDINDNSTPNSSTDVTGNYDISSTGRGTMALTDNTSGITYNYAIYVVGGQTSKASNPLILFVISDDDPQISPAVSGTIVFQDPTPAPYDVADFNAFSVSSLTGLDGTGTHTLVSATLAIGDGGGHINAVFDGNNAGTIVKAQSFNCSYTSSGGGRYIVTLLGNGTSCGSPALPFVFYASANSRGFLLDQSSAAVYTGQMDLQPGSNFAGSALAGSFAAATVSPGTSAVNEAALNLLFTAAAPNFSLTGSQDVTGDPNPEPLAGAYTVDFTTGTGTIKLTQPSDQNYVIYLLDNSKDGSIQHFVMINVDPANTNPAIIFAER